MRGDHETCRKTKALTCKCTVYVTMSIVLLFTLCFLWTRIFHKKIWIEERVLNEASSVSPVKKESLRKKSQKTSAIVLPRIFALNLSFECISFTVAVEKYTMREKVGQPGFLVGRTPVCSIVSANAFYAPPPDPRNELWRSECTMLEKRPKVLALKRGGGVFFISLQVRCWRMPEQSKLSHFYIQ